MPRGKRKKRSGRAIDENGISISQMEAMRRTLDVMGPDALPLEIKDYLASHYSCNMKPNVISNYKSTILGKKTKGKGRRKASRSTETFMPPTEPMMIDLEYDEVEDMSGFQIDDLRAVKEVVDRIGADKVRQLAQVLSE
jgi:hypothetical protein